jgi:hypothetical protein
MWEDVDITVKIALAASRPKCQANNLRSAADTPHPQASVDHSTGLTTTSISHLPFCPAHWVHTYLRLLLEQNDAGRATTRVLSLRSSSKTSSLVLVLPP